MPICPAKSYTLRYGLRTAIAIHWFDGSSILEYNMTTCCYGPLKEDLTFVRMLLISSKRNIIACVREDFPLPFIWPAEDHPSRRLPLSHMVSHRLDVRMFLTNSYGQPSTTLRSLYRSWDSLSQQQWRASSPRRPSSGDNAMDEFIPAPPEVSRFQTPPPQSKSPDSGTKIYWLCWVTT